MAFGFSCGCGVPPAITDIMHGLIESTSSCKLNTYERLLRDDSGEELRYDNTEAIMSSGYGIYLKSVNPLVTMPTKIVYRIPTDIEGEILWEPGRNKESKRLWCSFVGSKD